MTAQEAINAIYQGHLVECTRNEYQSGIRSALQNQAAKWIDQGDPFRAQIALQEVQRLDNKFDESIQANRG